MQRIILPGLSVPQAIEPISWTMPRLSPREPTRIPAISAKEIAQASFDALML
jgi:hypothetical protein